MIKLLAVLGFLVAAFPWSVAVGCSCRFGTLAQNYQRADNILVAKITSCASGALIGGRYCPDGAWTFETIENLKASHAQAGELSADMASGCAFRPKVGESYLLFLAEGRTDQCRGNQRLNGGGRSEVEVLRAYRDGKIPRITNPWYFSDRDGICSLSHRLDGSFIELQFYYGNAVPETLLLPSDARLPSKPVLEMGLKVFKPSGLEGQTLLQIGKRTVAVTRSRETGTAGLVYSFEDVSGDTALAVLDELSQGGEVTISGVRTSPRFGALPFRATTSASQGSLAMTEFKACVAAHPHVDHAR